jgi:hypothetical protein
VEKGNTLAGSRRARQTAIESKTHENVQRQTR